MTAFIEGGMRMTKTTFTLAEAAVLLSCHAETLRRAIKSGALPAARLGREYRISRVELQAFWAARGGTELFGDNAIALPLATAPSSLQAQQDKKKPSQLKLLE